LLGTAIGNGAVGDSLTARAGDTIARAVGSWTQASLSARIGDQIGLSIGSWQTSADSRPLSERVNAIFAQALGGSEGATWQGELRSMLDGASPIVTGLGALSTQIGALAAAMATKAANDNAQTAYDQGLQAFVTPIKSAASLASGTLAGAKKVDAADGKMVSTWMGVDATTGSVLSRGGKGSDSSSDARAQALATGLSAIAKQIETLTGGDIGSFSINASNKYGSGYSIGSIDRAQGFGINDFDGIARSFIQDALTTLGGGNQAAIDILKSTSFADLTSGFVSAAQQIYALTNPVRLATGGLVTGGTPGLDSVPALLMPSERVLSVPQSAMLETIYSAVAGRSRGQVASDPAQLTELRGLRAEVAAMTAELAAYRAEQAARDAQALRTAQETARATREKQAGGVRN
jgi:hypothetical protein